MRTFARMCLKWLLTVQRARPPGLTLLLVLNAWLVSLGWWFRGYRPLPFSREVRARDGRRAQIRSLGPDDVGSVISLISGLDEQDRSFVPHGTGRLTVRMMLGFRGFRPLGVFLEDEPSKMVGYGLCRPLPWRRALIAVVLSPERRGRRLGAMLLESLVDVTLDMDLMPYSLVYASNHAILACLEGTSLHAEPLDAEIFTVELKDRRARQRAVRSRSETP